MGCDDTYYGDERYKYHRSGIRRRNWRKFHMTVDSHYAQSEDILDRPGFFGLLSDFNRFLIDNIVQDMRIWIAAGQSNEQQRPLMYADHHYSS